MHSPQINRQMSRHRYDGFFALRPGGLCPFGQNGQPLFDRWILRLETDHAPSALHQSCSQPRVPSLGYAAWDPFTAAAAFPGTQPGVRTDGAPVVKPMPIADLAREHHASQFAQSGRNIGRSGRFQVAG